MPIDFSRFLWTSPPPVASTSSPLLPPSADRMTQPPGQPRLTPQFCFSAGTLRDFLRLSRSTIDDSISQNLNALLNPSARGFDPSSTSRRSPPSSTNSSKQIDTPTCKTFTNQVLFPAWQARSDKMHYCAVVATSPDPDDPEALDLEVEKQRDKERIVNERLDPYSGRFFPKEARTERLASLLRMESGVESIVRSRTWGVVKGRCGGDEDSLADRWEDGLDKWREDNGFKTGDVGK